MENVMVPRSLVERIEAILKCHAEYGMDHIFEETGDKTPNAILCEEIVTQLKTLAATTTVEQEPVAWVSKRGMSWLERKHPSTIEPVGAVASEVNCIPLYDHPYPPADKQAAQDIFEKCARICEALACPDSVDEFRDGAWRCAPGYDYFREAAEAIRAEALKVSAGGR